MCAPRDFFRANDRRLWKFAALLNIIESAPPPISIDSTPEFVFSLLFYLSLSCQSEHHP